MSNVQMTNQDGMNGSYTFVWFIQRVDDSSATEEVAVRDFNDFVTGVVFLCCFFGKSDVFTFSKVFDWLVGEVVGEAVDSMSFLDVVQVAITRGVDNSGEIG